MGAPAYMLKQPKDMQAILVRPVAKAIGARWPEKTGKIVRTFVTGYGDNGNVWKAARAQRRPDRVGLLSNVLMKLGLEDEARRTT